METDPDTAGRRIARRETPIRLSDNFLSQVFTISPLVVVGTTDDDGTTNLAVKHRCLFLGNENQFAFVCTPAHRTYTNILRERRFCVSFPTRQGVVAASVTSAPRQANGCKPLLSAVPAAASPANVGPIMDEAYLWLECDLARIVDDLGDHHLIVGIVTASYSRDEFMRHEDRDDHDLLSEKPILAYVAPGRLASVSVTHAFPFHEGLRA